MRNENQNDINEFCRGLYPKTERFFEENDIFPKFGFKILNGPPLKNAPYLFVGFQPGGGAEDYEEEVEKGTETGWPDICEFATVKKWPLVKQMQKIFAVELLERCVGTNAIFLRYPNEDEYNKHVGSKRKEIERFCMDAVCEIVEKIKPLHIVAIGFRTLEMFGPTESELKSEKERVLVKAGMIAGRRVSGIIHVSGCRISNADIGLLSKHFKKQNISARL